jgi:hypothetical protein
MSTFDGRQITAARALAELTVAELAEAAGVAVSLCIASKSGASCTLPTNAATGMSGVRCGIRSSPRLNRHGVELLPETAEHGAGVRWRVPRAQRQKNW